MTHRLTNIQRAARGNPGRRPDRIEPAPCTGDLPKPPSNLSKPAKRIWRELVADMAADGMYRPTFANTLANYCECQAVINTWRKANPGIFPPKEVMSMLRFSATLAHQLGLSPGGFNRLVLPEKPKTAEPGSLAEMIGG